MASAASARARHSSAAQPWPPTAAGWMRRRKEFAAEALEAAAADIEFHDGRFRIAGTDRSITFSELDARQPQRVIRVSATETPSTPSWPNGAQVCEVEIDPETGVVEVASLASCDDIGRIINHAIVEG